MGRFTNQMELFENLSITEDALKKAILAQEHEDWNKNVTTAEFGIVTKAEALSRIISHSAYHTGQIALILKYA